MNILVLNGSPKGKYSITLQTVHYLAAMYPEQHFDILHVGQKIKSLEKDFSPAREMLENADLILFSYPVYTFIVPCQLQRFIELMKESGIDLSGKWATQLSTSKHFYDMTAHRYIQENCVDMGMKYIHGLSADMEDLLSSKGQQDARAFFDYVCWCMSRNISEPASPSAPPVSPVHIDVPSSVDTEKTGDVVIITDCAAHDTQLQQMIARFQGDHLKRKTRLC